MRKIAVIALAGWAVVYLPLANILLVMGAYLAIDRPSDTERWLSLAGSAGLALIGGIILVALMKFAFPNEKSNAVH